MRRCSVTVSFAARVRDSLSVSVTLVTVEPAGIDERSKAITARRLSSRSVIPVNRSSPAPLLRYWFWSFKSKSVLSFDA